jgi:NRAMP (natural resistance-associated macrophage protein)-like metal ion transporter
VTAAFIGPGTVTVCTKAGVAFGYDLLWALALSIIACLVLQEMAARLGIVSQKGLSEVLRSEIHNPVLRSIMIFIIISAIFIGNAAYEAGNLSGAVLGLSSVINSPFISLGEYTFNYFSVLIGLIAFIILYIGKYKIIEKSLISLVIFMSLAFIITAILTKPNILDVLQGFIPNFSSEKTWTVIGLIGTTVVPYNLFLHASLVSEKWKSTNDLQAAKRDTQIAILLGGLISMAIIVAAASVQKEDIVNAADLALSLEPLFGEAAKHILALGLFAAGITSAITAPLAAAYVVKGCFGWKDGLKSKKFRLVWIIVLLIGVVFSSVGFKSIEIISFAQITNGLLLPVVAAFLLWAMNQSNLLGAYTNTKAQNFVAFIILIITIGLGAKSIWLAIENIIV